MRMVYSLHSYRSDLRDRTGTNTIAESVSMTVIAAFICASTFRTIDFMLVRTSTNADKLRQLFTLHLPEVGKQITDSQKRLFESKIRHNEAIVDQQYCLFLNRFSLIRGLCGVSFNGALFLILLT